MIDVAPEAVPLPDTMRAMALMSLGGPEGIAEMRLTVPTPAENEALIRVRTVAVNHQDLFTMSGRARNAKVTFPHVMGIDPSGVIAAIGSGVENLSVGDRVAVKPPVSCGVCEYCVVGLDDSCQQLRNIGVHRDGGHAEYVTVPERSVFVIADGVNHVDATAIAHSFPVALQMFERVELDATDVVLVTGAAGAVGSAAVQLAKLAGAFVIAATGSPDRAADATSAGADATIDYTQDREFSAEVRRIVPGGVSVYVETASNPAIWREALKTLRPRARAVVCGSHAGPGVELDNNWLFRSRVAIFGSSGSTLRGMRKVLDLAASGEIRANVDSVRPLAEIRAAFQDLCSRNNRGKIVLRVSDG